jgi:branched-chain amino acid transport system substrate-binding protein
MGIDYYRLWTIESVILARRLTTTELYVLDVNAGGGIDGHPLELRVYDDRSDPAVASANAAEILAGPAVGVVGHSGGITSIAAGERYRQGHIPAVTGHAGSDDVTRGNPYYFRTISAASTEAAFLARYIRAVAMPRSTAFMRAPDIDVVTTEDPFGRAFRAGYDLGNFGDPVKSFIVVSGAQLEANAEALADRLALEPGPRIIVLGAEMDAIGPLVKAIRRRGIRGLLVLSSGAASDSFAAQFRNEPEERDQPGYFLDSVFAIAPAIMDNVGLYGQGLATHYQAKTGVSAAWFAAGAQDSARMLVTAIRDAHIAGSQQAKQALRDKVRDALAAIDGPGAAVTGISGKLYFDANRDIPRAMRYGFFHTGHLVTAPLQLVPIKDRELVDIKHEMDQGHILEIGEEFYWLQRIVATGIDIVRLNAIDIKAGTFNADFYFWMRYADGDASPERIEFPGFLGKFDGEHPLKSSVVDGTVYRLWRMSGDFKGDFDLHDYPFDTQALVIRMRNVAFPRERIAYAIDTFGLKLDDVRRSVSNGEAFRDLQLWRAIAVRPFTETFSIQSTLGNPALFETPNRMEYGALALAVVVQRNAMDFMIKALLPLFLLTLVVFATLFFPANLASQRTTIPVTAILTTAVLMISMTSQLPALGYTVALEYMFYAFFMLCLTAMIIGLMAELLRDKSFHQHVIKADLLGRVVYLLVTLLMIGVFVWKYGPAPG